MGLKNVLVLAVPREDSFLAIYALFLMDFQQDAIHAPSLFAVAVSRNVSGGLQGTSTDR